MKLKLTLSRVHYQSPTTSYLHGYCYNALTVLKETGDEEKKEVSLALRKLRLKYDAIHKLVIEKEEQLELIKV